MSSATKRVYANEKQIKFLKSRAKRKTFQGGRGSGKTSTLGFKAGMGFERLPRAKGGLVGLTYVQLDTIVLPGINEALGWMGYREYSKANPFGVYVVGVRPPDHWIKPYKAPGRLGYQYCISFINGFTIQLISQDRPETNRGLNLDFLWMDESATINEDFVNKIALPAVRANKHKSFSSDALHHSVYDFSSASWTMEGNWIYKTEEKYLEMLEERKKMTPDELEKTAPTHLYLESTYRDNQEILPDNYSELLRQALDPLEYDVEVENMRVTKRPEGFYHGFSTEKHCYTYSYSYLYDDKTGLHIPSSNDYLDNRALEISLDFNADICWALVGQEVGKEARIVNSNYTKPSLSKEEKSVVSRNAEWFVSTYSSHRKKEVYLYGDPGGNSRSAGTSKDNLPFFDEFSKILTKAGWVVYRRELTSYPRHKDKYALLNMLMSEGQSHHPKLRINKTTNKVLIIALQAAKADSATFEKIKTSERRAKHREYATDSTDALDYWLWAKYSQLLPTHRSQKNQLYVYGR